MEMVESPPARACSKCGREKSDEDFPDVGNRCRDCVAAYHRDWRARNRATSNEASRRWKERNPDRPRAARLLREYGVTPDDVAAMMADQAGRCPICHEPLGERWAVDHCHDTGKVRGLLHIRCNAGLGSLKDNYLFIQRAAAYLMKHHPQTRIHPWAVIGDPPEHREYIWKFYDGAYDQYASPFFAPEIHETAIVGAFCTIDAGINQPTRVGAHTLLMKRTHLGHDVQIGARCELGAGVVLCGEVVVEDDVQIGGNTWVRPKVRIGKGARVGGGAVVVKDVPAGAVWAGNPAKPLVRGREARRRGQGWDGDIPARLGKEAA